jgi:mannose-6-phosphate isomerase-like protein (cupin superfamily)
MRLGETSKRVGQGSVFWVPRGTLHAFRNASGDPAVAYVVYFPPFDGQDRVVEEAD